MSTAITETAPVGIRTERLDKRFTMRGVLPGRPRGHVDALKQVSLSVDPATIHGIIGPNGSGKSTLLRILATLVLPSSGTVHLGGVDVVADPLAARRLLGFSTGDERSLYWRLSGRRNLLFYAALCHLPDPESSVATVLERMDLAAAADRPVSGYSQGMARRLALGRAMLHEPPILLLDEPARSLDPISRDRLHEVLRDLCDRRRATILMATHDLSEAAKLCERVSILRSGRIVREMVPTDAEGLGSALRRWAV